MEERLRLFDFWAQAQHHWREFTPICPSGGDVQKIIENDISRHLHHDFFPSLRFIFHILIMYVQKRNVTILTISHFYCGSQFFSSFVGGRRNTLRKAPTFCKSLTKFIAEFYNEVYALPH